MMKQHETEHYIFNYEEGSLAEKNICVISNEQEQCYEYIVSVLNKQPEQKINYFLYEDAKVLGKIYCEICNMEYPEGYTLNGFTLDSDIYAAYNEQTKCIGFHKDAHLVSMSDGIWSESTAILEGLAMYFDRVWWGIHNMHWDQYYIKSNQFISPDKLIKDNEYFYSLGAEITYPIMGAFTEWIISSYGVEKYMSFYNESDAMIAANKIFHKTMEELSILFRNYISLFNCDEILEQRMCQLSMKNSKEREN
ncbi:MAG: hypothetical protein MRZ36_07840 [Eubacterium sp.]|nr:hypothetical protein [Eubacterium sp.]